MSSSTMKGAQVVERLSQGTELADIDGLCSTRAVFLLRMGASERSVEYVEPESEFSTVCLEHASDDARYVMSGTGTVLSDDVLDEWPVFEGSIVHISDGSRYRFQFRDDDLTLFGKACPSTPAVFGHLEN